MEKQIFGFLTWFDKNQHPIAVIVLFSVDETSTIVVHSIGSRLDVLEFETPFSIGIR